MANHRTISLTRLHPEYPIALSAMRRAPETLYLRGRYPQQPAIAIVGTRQASSAALQFTRHLAARLAEAGLAVWSGGAAGIDTAAHWGALDGKGATVVVMGTGFDHVYPVENRELFERVLHSDGAWLTPFAAPQPGARWTFLLRNELLAAAVQAVVIIQAPVRSGARSTVASARKMNKPVWAVPGAPWDRLSAGCLEELRLGAQLLQSPEQLLTRYASRWAANRPAPPAQTPPATPLTPSAAQDLSPTEKSVLKALAQDSLHPDEICNRASLPAAQVASALLTLTLRRILVESADGHFQIVNLPIS